MGGVVHSRAGITVPAPTDVHIGPAPGPGVLNHALRGSSTEVRRDMSLNTLNVRFLGRRSLSARVKKDVVHVDRKSSEKPRLPTC